MASSDEFQERLEAVDEYLEFLTETLESAKVNMEITKKVIEDKEIKKDTKITIDANITTVVALKRALVAVKKSVEGDFKTIDDVENTLETLKISVELGRKFVQNGDKTEDGVMKHVDPVEKNTVAIGSVERASEVRQNDKKCVNATEIVNKALYAEIKNEVREETLEIERNVNEKNCKIEGKTEKTIESEQKDLIGCNTSEKLGTNETTSVTNKTIVRDIGKPKKTKEEYELVKEKSAQPTNPEITKEEFAKKISKKISVRPKENTEITREEYELTKKRYVRPKEESVLAKERSVRPKEKPRITKNFDLDEKIFVRPKEMSKVTKEEFELARDKSVRPKEKRPKEESELAKEISVRPKEKPRITNNFDLDEEMFVRPKDLPKVVKKEFELVKDESVRPKMRPKEESELAKKNLVGPEEKSEATKEEINLSKNESVRTEEKFSETEESPETEETIAHVKHLGMDNPMNAMLFSEQLIEYVLNKLGYTWPCIEGARNLPNESVSRRFSKVIGETMIDIIDSNIGNIAESYKQLVEKNVRKIHSFRTEVCITATFYFSNGYSHYNFLMYAAQLAGLSAFYFASGNTQIADASSHVLAYILNYYIYQLWFLPGCDWFNLHLEAQKLRKLIQDRKIKFVMPAGSALPVPSGTESLS